MGRVGDHLKSRRQLLDGISMGHPYRKSRDRIQAKEQIGVVIDAQIGPAKFSMGCGIDRASALMGEQLHAIADTQNGDVEFKNLAVHFRGLGLCHTGRPS